MNDTIIVSTSGIYFMDSTPNIRSSTIFYIFARAYMVGVGTGLTFKNIHTRDTLQPIIRSGYSYCLQQYFDTCYGTSIIFYFIFSARVRDNSNTTWSIRCLGRIAVMFSFRAKYGTTVATRMAYLARAGEFNNS